MKIEFDESGMTATEIGLVRAVAELAEIVLERQAQDEGVDVTDGILLERMGHAPAVEFMTKHLPKGVRFGRDG